MKSFAGLKISFKYFLLIFVCILLSSVSAFGAESSKNCPIILVHGWAGWGPDELAGLPYWGGGSFDVKAFLEQQGCTVYVATVGALASNWDRAIELFYQIKGGQVDYGYSHSKRYGHLQRPSGKYYDKPFYPQWDADHPVHLVGHSMGGQTVRMLSALLAGRTRATRNIFKSSDNQTFTPGEGWIKSVTTISAPNNGSSLFDIVDNDLGIALAVLQLAGFENNTVIPDDFYSLGLEQWGVTKEDNETLEAYLARLFDTLGSSRDFSVRELSTFGASLLNSRVNFTTVDPGAYYFSFATSQTAEALESFYVPEMTMNPIFVNYAYIIGTSPTYTDVLRSGTQWRQNDGVVNTLSMIGPQAGCSDTCVIFDGTPRKNVWNHMGTFNYDHADIIGWTQILPDQIELLKEFYLLLAETLSGLE